MLDMFLDNEKKVAGIVRHAIGILGGIGVGYAVFGQGDVDSLLKAVDNIFSNVEGLVSAGVAASAIVMSLVAKVKAAVDPAEPENPTE